MNSDPAETATTAGSPRGIAARVLQLIATRIELLGFEFAEERRNAGTLLFLLLGSAALSFLGIILLAAAGILALDPAWRPWGAGLAGIACMACAVWMAFRVRRIVRERPPPFAATVAELKRDREWLENLK